MSRVASGLREVFRTYVLAALVLLPVAAVTLRLSKPAVAASDTVMASAIPRRIAEYAGEDRSLRARTLELLETEDVVNRIYAAGEGSTPIGLCIVNSPDNRKIAHPPEVCYTGWGYEVVDRTETSIRAPGGALIAAFLTVRKGGASDSVLYWYRSGTAEGASYYAEQWRAILGALTGRPAATSLVRLSTSEWDGRPKARERLTRFAELLLPILRSVSARPPASSR